MHTAIRCTSTGKRSLRCVSGCAAASLHRCVPQDRAIPAVENSPLLSQPGSTVVAVQVAWPCRLPRNRSRSPSDTAAVRAHIGVRSRLPDSWRRISEAASAPFICGMWRSIRITSKRSSAAKRTASSPFPATCTSCACFSKRRGCPLPEALLLDCAYQSSRQPYLAANVKRIGWIS
jgi:hypothetical protein